MALAQIEQSSNTQTILRSSIPVYRRDIFLNLNRVGLNYFTEHYYSKLPLKFIQKGNFLFVTKFALQSNLILHKPLCFLHTFWKIK